MATFCCCSNVASGSSTSSLRRLRRSKDHKKGVNFTFFLDKAGFNVPGNSGHEPVLIGDVSINQTPMLLDNDDPNSTIGMARFTCTATLAEVVYNQHWLCVGVFAIGEAGAQEVAAMAEDDNAIPTGQISFIGTATGLNDNVWMITGGTGDYKDVRSGQILFDITLLGGGLEIYQYEVDIAGK